jgi:hypothetical protein
MNTLFADPYLWIITLTTMLAWCFRRTVMNWLSSQLSRKPPVIGLDDGTYHVIHHITLPVEAGQAPNCHLYVSRYGIFLVDAFDYGGLIFGNGHEAQWTRRLGPKHSQKFHNPLMLAHRRAKTLAKLLIIPEAQLLPIVLFNGEEHAWFNTPMPECVCCDQKSLIRFIQHYQTPVLADSEVTRILETIATKQLAATAAEPYLRNSLSTCTTQRQVA